MVEPVEEDHRGPLQDAPTTARLHAAALFCDVCGRTTDHRILRVDPRAAVRPGHLGGLARCRVCRWTHPFEASRPEVCEVKVVVSEGERSRTTRIALAPSARLEVGGLLPDDAVPRAGGAERGVASLPGSGPDASFRIRRIDARSRAGAPEARAVEVETLWVAPDRAGSVAVSITGGARTRAARATVAPDVALVVGEPIEVEGRMLTIAGLRARGRTWRRPGDRFPAVEVQRVYARRTVIPPAGRSDWSRSREIPSSRASSTSRSERSRSGPGLRRNRSVPRARTAEGGATVHNVEP